MIGSSEISLIFTGTKVFALGIYVISANPRKEVNRVFALICIFAAIWCFGVLAVHLSPNRLEAMRWGKFPFLGCMLAAAFFFYFSFVFPERPVGRWIVHPLVLIIPGIGFALVSFSNLVLEDVRLEPWGYGSVHGPLHGPFVICLFLYLVTGIIHLLVKYSRTSSPRKRLQLRYVLIGVTIAPLFAFVTNGILPMVGNARFTYIGPISLLLFIASTSYTIVKHRLLDIDLFIKKGTSSLLVLFIICFPSFLALIALENAFYGQVHYEFTL